MRATPMHLVYDSLNQKIKDGTIKIPQFQRDFVWSISDSAKLIDSLIKGYPIGSFIIWKTRERLKAVKNIGGIDFPDTSAGEVIQYVLDGQQRITSIFAALNGVNIVKDNTPIDYSNIYIDLSVSLEEQLVVTEVTSENENSLIKVVSLLNSTLQEQLEYVTKYGHISDAITKIQSYRDAIKTYQFSVIYVDDAPLDIATEIFTRLNVGGKSLSTFEIMVAKTYDEGRNFDLAEKFNVLKAELEGPDFDTISSSTILQSISVCLAKDARSKAILSLNKDLFINSWSQTTEALKAAVDYFRSSYGIKVSSLLPYEALLVLFTYYFYNHHDRPEGNNQYWLRDYFWRSVLSERFSSSADTKINSDIEIIDCILADTAPNNLFAVDVSLEYLKMHGSFSTSSAFTKGVLCILAACKPVSFIDGADVTIDNSWLKQANSKNYHHFFPKAFMRRAHPEVDEWLVNHIANITIVDDFLNKRRIRDRAPSNYIQDFSKVNTSLEQALETHLITYNSTDDSGIGSDNYDVFFEKRLERIQSEFKSRIIITNRDRTK